jgi:methionyl-tRNA formyltransferase
LARLDFTIPAEELHNRVRALKAGPKPYMLLSLKSKPSRVIVLKTCPDPESGDRPGVLGSILRVEAARGVLVQCASGRLWVQEVQPEGKRPISAADFINGARLKTDGLLEIVHEREGQ